MSFPLLINIISSLSTPLLPIIFRNEARLYPLHFFPVFPFFRSCPGPFSLLITIISSLSNTFLSFLGDEVNGFRMPWNAHHPGRPLTSLMSTPLVALWHYLRSLFPIISCPAPFPINLGSISFRLYPGPFPLLMQAISFVHVLLLFLSSVLPVLFVADSCIRAKKAKIQIPFG
jgi:hypothetical protein